jgi:hypothetical protein
LIEKEDIFMDNEYRIDFAWDDEASVWIATSDGIPGLILEHESFDVLVGRVRRAAPELLAFDRQIDGDIFLDIATSRQEKVTVGG